MHCTITISHFPWLEYQLPHLFIRFSQVDSLNIISYIYIYILKDEFNIFFYWRKRKWNREYCSVETQQYLWKKQFPAVISFLFKTRLQVWVREKPLRLPELSPITSKFITFDSAVSPAPRVVDSSNPKYNTSRFSFSFSLKKILIY